MLCKQDVYVNGMAITIIIIIATFCGSPFNVIRDIRKWAIRKSPSWNSEIEAQLFIQCAKKKRPLQVSSNIIWIYVQFYMNAWKKFRIHVRLFHWGKKDENIWRFGENIWVYSGPSHKTVRLFSLPTFKVGGWMTSHWVKRVTRREFLSVNGFNL